MSDDLPFSAEYAKSDRSSCKTCGGKIPKDHVRIAVMVQSTHFDGKMPLWNHFNCFFRKNGLKSTGDMKGFGSLRYEDQAKIKEKVGGSVRIGKGEKVSADVCVEYAKSARAQCRGCFTTIEKDAVRIGCWVQAEGKELKWAKNGKKQAWHHPACFVKRREELSIDTGLTADILDGFTRMKDEDKAELILLLGKGGKRRRKAKEAASNAPKPLSSHEKKLKAQSKFLLEIRDALKDVNNKYLREMLELNNYPTHGADIRLIDRCSDGIAFGRFDETCTICGSDYFSLGDNQYECKGDVSQFTKCTNTLPTPSRRLWVIPKSVKEQSDFLAKLKLKTGTRLFMEADPSSVSLAGGGNSGPHFKDYVFCCPLDTIDIAGDGHEIRPLLTQHGGKVYKKFTAKCNVLVTDDVDNKMSKRAAGLEIPIVDVVKLVQGLTSGKLPDIGSVCYSGFEGDDYVKKRRNIKRMKESAKEEEHSSEEQSNKRAKVTVQNGAEVFTESGLHDNPNVKVYKDHAGVVYAATLGLVDIAQGRNSYYKLQILERGDFKYDLFRAWGRIGTEIGGTKFDSFRTPHGAIDMFMFHYEEKTGNVWGDPFSKVAGKMYRIDVDYGPSDDIDDSVKPGSLTKLEPGIQDLINLIFDVKAMKDTLMQFEIDLNKMPLGKLSRNQIREAFTVLTAVQSYIDDPAVNRVLIVDASTRFFTLIPHDFGMGKPPILDSKEMIQSKTEMLEALLELEIAYSMTKRDSEDQGKDPIDIHFLKLKCEMSILPRDTEEFDLLKKYVSSTHAETHDQYQLEIENIFKVERQGEYSRYTCSEAKFHTEPYSTLHNRMLLWHGSRISNFAGILSQGLRIAPPEAPVTGYMFGKGVYFADMVSKSANYCYTSRSNPTGLLLLCEVALGDMYTLQEAKYINKPPKGKHSTKGCGKTGPSSYHTLPNGCVVPLGPPTEQSDAEESSLLYNEYIVYDVAQINVKYLFQLRFDYNSRSRG